MNAILFTSIAIVFALPGLLLYRYSATGKNYRSFVAPKNFAEEIAIGLFVSLVLHSVMLSILLLFRTIFNIKFLDCFRATFIYKVLVLHDSAYLHTYFNSAELLFYLYTVYFIISIILGINIGIVIHDFIEKHKMDLKNKIFQRKSFWWYLLTGRNQVEKASEMNNKNNKLVDIFVYAAATVLFNDKCYLYRGIVNDFITNRDGTLDSIMLMDVKYRDLHQHQKKEKKYYRVKSDFLTISASNIKTMSLEYYLAFETEDNN